jgi:hypothetical protein
VSHFTLLVVTAVEPTDSVLAEVLAPFVEEVGPGDQYAVWKDCTQEVEDGFDAHPTKRLEHSADNPDAKPWPEYSTLDEYAKGWLAYSKNAAGRWGYFHNPNAKWDGYQLGGRWAGSLETRKGAAGVSGWGESPAGQFDAAKVSDLVTDLAAEPQFAILAVDGAWHERGKMGWWGTASNEQTPEQWAGEYSKCIAAIDPSHWVAVVDCHI